MAFMVRLKFRGIRDGRGEDVKFGGPAEETVSFGTREEAEAFCLGINRAYDLMLGWVNPSLSATIEKSRCPDDGACHHACSAGSCFRVSCCSPLSGVYPDDEWPEDIKAKHKYHQSDGS